MLEYRKGFRLASAVSGAREMDLWPRVECRFCLLPLKHVVNKQVPYFISNSQREHSNPFPCSPGSHSQLVSLSVGITNSCSLLHFHSRSALRRHVYAVSASRYPSRTRNCGRLLMAATQSSRLNCQSQLVRSHGNNVCDIIIAHVISADAQINIYTNRRGNCKVILGPPFFWILFI